VGQDATVEAEASGCGAEGRQGEKGRLSHLLILAGVPVGKAFLASLAYRLGAYLAAPARRFAGVSPVPPALPARYLRAAQPPGRGHEA
jgi:hypothetical protein